MGRQGGRRSREMPNRLAVRFALPDRQALEANRAPVKLGL